MNLRLAMCVIAFAGLFACATSVLSAYESARSQALADPGALPEDWQPDILLKLSKDETEQLTSMLLDTYGAFDTRFSKEVLGVTVSVVPDLKLESLEFSASKSCDSCVALNTHASGTIRVTAGREQFSTPTDVRAALDMAIEAKKGEATWSVFATPKDVRELDIQFGNLQASLQDLVKTGLRDQLRQRLLEKLEPIEIATFGSADLPIRAFRVAAGKGGLDLSLLTVSPTPTAARPDASFPRDGFSLRVSTDSLLDLARAAAFRAGPVSYGVVVEPTSFTITDAAFQLGLRLWKPDRAGWWRDYTVSGTLEKAKRGLKLEPKEVTEGQKSPGAALADPLAALAESYILKTIEESVSTSLPDRRTTRVDQLRSDLRIESVTGRDGDLVVTGVLALREGNSEHETRDRASGTRHRP